MSVADITQDDVQRAIDEMAAVGGGTVTLPPGVVSLRNALRLRSNVRVVGSPEGTTLRRMPSIARRLVDRVGYGHYEFTVEEPDLFPIGSGVYIYDDLAWGYYTTVATVVGRSGDLIFIDRPFSHDYGPGANGMVVRLFSIVEGANIRDAAIANLALDGNRDETRLLDGCRGAGVALHRADRVSIENVEVMNFNGDAIAVGQCTDILIRNNCVHHNAGIGIHPGSGTVRYVIEDNRIHDNGSHGIFYCLRSSHSDCRGNRIERNGDAGISVGERDTHHLIRDNIIVENAGSGIEFRKFVRRGGDYVRLERNTIGPNCRSTLEHEIMIAPGHRDLYIAHNIIVPAPNKKSIQVGSECMEIYLVDNMVSGKRLTARDVEAMDGSVSYIEPAELMDIGPAALRLDGARHLNIDLLQPWSKVERECEQQRGADHVFGRRTGV